LKVFLYRWVWSVISTISMFLIPLEKNIMDTKQADAQLARD